jgi:membrane-associated phospholipid phosphatase
MLSLDVRGWRSSERLLLVYFTYVALVAALLRPDQTWKTAILAVAVSLVLAFLARGESIARDLAPLAFTFAAFREMNWFTPPVHEYRFERSWILWDRLLLDDYGFRFAIESMGAVLPAFLELCYALVYSVAYVAIAALFVARRREHVDRLWIAYLTGTLGAYALFPYFPSEPPRRVFPGADLPNIVTFLRSFNLWIVENLGIHSSVFPSAHVSSALSAAWGLLAAIPRRRWIGRAMAAYALCVAVAAVYGRYHYAVDALAGIATSALGAAALYLSRPRH